jgi:hypothetical protein
MPFFGELSFTETVGRFLRANRTEGKDLLLSQLNPADFAFTLQEYEEIVAAIYASEPLFRRFPTLHHPLNRLNHNVFNDHDKDKGRAWTEARSVPCWPKQRPCTTVLLVKQTITTKACTTISNNITATWRCTSNVSKMDWKMG